ncbi:hypothetical protein GCM10010533_46770 [Mycolicibacterium pallens]
MAGLSLSKGGGMRTLRRLRRRVKSAFRRDQYLIYKVLFIVLLVGVTVALAAYVFDK